MNFDCSPQEAQLMVAQVRGFAAIGMPATAGEALFAREYGRALAIQVGRGAEPGI